MRGLRWVLPGVLLVVAAAAGRVPWELVWVSLGAAVVFAVLRPFDRRANREMNREP